MLIESIDLMEFRGIMKCERPLSLSKFTVLIGRNNSGKSSVLEALSLFPLPEYQTPYSNKTKLDVVTGLHSGVSSLVYGYSGSTSIEYTIDGRRWGFRLDEMGRRVNFTISDYQSERLLNDPFSCVVKTLRDHLQLREGLSEGEAVSKLVFFIPYDTAFLNELAAQTSQGKNQNMITKSGAHARVARELINKCIDDKYTEFVLLYPTLKVRKERGDGQPLYVDVRDLGDGIEKASILGLWLDALNPPLVLWDDFEGSAHPSLIMELLKWLSGKKWQVVLSTHSIDVLSNLVDVGPKDAKIIQLRKTNEDNLQHKTLTLDELEDVLDSSQDPRMMVSSLGL